MVSLLQSSWLFVSFRKHKEADLCANSNAPSLLQLSISFHDARVPMCCRCSCRAMAATSGPRLRTGSVREIARANGSCAYGALIRTPNTRLVTLLVVVRKMFIVFLMRSFQEPCSIGQRSINIGQPVDNPDREPTRP